MIYKVTAHVPIVFEVEADSALAAQAKAMKHLSEHFPESKLLSIVLVSPTSGDPDVEKWVDPQVGVRA